MKNYDVIIIGAGHAGIEAATASARLNAKTLLITNNLENLGELSCNPSIGGIGKGTIVKEIDALDGIMAKAVDFASIHRKILNSSKGVAVHGPRHQIDRILYKNAIKILLNDYKNLIIKYISVKEILLNSFRNEIIGIKTENNDEIFCKSLVITTGTFLNGQIIIGNERYSAGRINENSSINLGKSIQSLGLNMSRLKTGTPCRLEKNSINYSDLEEQISELEMSPMSYMNSKISNPQISCFITYTNQKSHDLIIQNKEKIPTLNGDIKFKGPRYCPSIEDKVRRFSSKDRHQIFLEPEGLSSDLIYPNGISTSMSKDLQIEFIKSIEGLENAKISQFGYAIEYDFVNPTEVFQTLETKKIKNLFLAGQILGTTGYEEAAGLGIVAGINAALKCFNKEFILSRSSSYIGVMIDDLTILGIDGEPYRMFTSRSEYRLSCRSDNADFRLTPIGINLELIQSKRKMEFLEKQKNFDKTMNLLLNLSATPAEIQSKNIPINQDGIRRNAFEILQCYTKNFDDLIKIWPQLTEIPKNFQELINTEAKYFPYTKRQEFEISELQKNENVKIPQNFDFKKINSLSSEVIEKLNKFQPQTLAQIAKIPGITPAAVVAIMIFLKNK